MELFLCTAPATRKAAAAQRRPRAPQLLQEALCTAPATRNAARKLYMYCACHEKGSRGPATATRPAAPRGGSVHCACHAKRSQEALCTAPATRKAAAAQRRPRAPQLLQEALCTAPATRNAARKLYMYCACHEKGSRGPAAATRPAAPRGGSVYCACHAKRSQEALCTAPATRKASGGHARRSSSRRLCVLRLPRENAARKLCVLHLPRERQLRPSGGHARRSSSRRLCVLRLPRETQPGSSVYCTCHEKGSRGRSGGHARRSSSRRLCALPGGNLITKNVHIPLSSTKKYFHGHTLFSRPFALPPTISRFSRFSTAIQRFFHGQMRTFSRPNLVFTAIS